MTFFYLSSSLTKSTYVKYAMNSVFSNVLILHSKAVKNILNVAKNTCLHTQCSAMLERPFLDLFPKLWPFQKRCAYAFLEKCIWYDVSVFSCLTPMHHCKLRIALHNLVVVEVIKQHAVPSVGATINLCIAWKTRSSLNAPNIICKEMYFSHRM